MPHSRSLADLRGHQRSDAPVVGATNFAGGAGTPAPSPTPVGAPKQQTTTADGPIGERIGKRVQGAKDSVQGVKDLVKKLGGSSGSFP